MSGAMAASLVLFMFGPHVPVPPDEPVAVSDDVLAEQRGGLKLPNGAEISFGVSRQVFANGLALSDALSGAEVALVLQNSLDAQRLQVVTTYDIHVRGLHSLDAGAFERPSGVPDLTIPW